MYGDLDFAGHELQARGVVLDCYTPHNPLLIRPEQKLGRVLAAQSIITEMVETVAGSTMMPVLVQYDATHPRPPQVVSGRAPIFKSGAEPTEESSDDEEHPQVFPTVTKTDNRDNQQLESADMMILQIEDDMGSARSTLSADDAVYHNEDSCSNSPDLPADHELIGMLDESLSGFVIPNHAGLNTVLQNADLSAEIGRCDDSSSPDSGFDGEAREINGDELDSQSIVIQQEDPILGAELETEPAKVLSPDIERSDSPSSSDYDGEFEAETQKSDSVVAKEKLVEMDDAGPQVEVPIEPQNSERSDYDDGFEAEVYENNTLDPEADSNISSDERNERNPIVCEDALIKPVGYSDGSSNDNQSGPLSELETLEHAEEVQNPNADMTLLLHDTLKEYCERFDSTPVLTFDAVECKKWCDTHRPLYEALDGNDSIQTTLADSLFSIIDHYQIMISPTAAVSFMKSDGAKILELVSCLWTECMCIVDETFGYFAEQIENNIKKGNSLVSELEMDDLVESTESVFQRFEEATRICSQACRIMRLLYKENDSELPLLPRQSTGISRVLKVFYPYLVNQAREKLSAHWKRIVDMFTSVDVNIIELSCLMDSTCKALILNAHSLSPGNGDSASESSDADEENCKLFPKIALVCDRHDILSTSLECVWSKCLSSRSKQCFAVFPFFLSAFGEKVVADKRVEEGEGKGPLKEWFVLVSHALASKWEDIAVDSSTDTKQDQEITVNGNKLTTSTASYLMQPGFRVQWTSSESGESVSRVINKRVDDESVLLDRGVPAEAFPASQLRISRPQHAYLEYKQDTECFWLNEQTEDTTENRRVLCFMGWFVANAVTHFTNVDTRVHRLLFHLLLNGTYSVSLDDAMQIDPTWHKALMQTKAMQTNEWIEFLEMEGLPETMSHDAYAEHVLAEKFGSKSNILWQIQEFRSGFECVLSLDSLRAAGIDADDLVTIICGSGEALDTDFRVDQVFRVSSDPDFISSGPLHRAFWTAVNSLDIAKKRKFVKFVTGVETLPLAGTEVRFLSLSIENHPLAHFVLSYSSCASRCRLLPSRPKTGESSCRCSHNLMYVCAWALSSW